MRSCARSPIRAILALLGILLSGSSALAEDYSVDFGADADRGRDAGTLHCRFGQICDAKLESLGLTVVVDISRGDPASPYVSLNGHELDCCYFAYGKDHTPLSRVPLFKGEGARGGLFIENERMGTLYFRFHFHRDRVDNLQRSGSST